MKYVATDLDHSGAGGEAGIRPEAPRTGGGAHAALSRLRVQVAGQVRRLRERGLGAALRGGSYILLGAANCIWDRNFMAPADSVGAARDVIWQLH